MDRKYKPIRPAIKSPVGQFSDRWPDRPETFKRKRVHVKVACDACRIKKTACDGQRPTCGPCIRRESPCTFRDQPQVLASSSSSTAASGSSSPDKGRNSKAAQVLTAIVAVSEDRALDLLTQLRRGEDLTTVLENAQVPGGFNTSGQLVQGGSSFGSAPNQTSVEFELMVRHPMVYPAFVALDTSLYANRPLRGVNPFKALDFDDEEVFEPAADRMETDTQAPVAAPLPVSQTRPAGTYCDSRLSRVRFKDWTDVPINNSQAAHTISRYLEVDHPILGLFDADLFLHDLANLGFTPSADASSSPVTASSPIAEDFYTEATKMWHDGEDADSITSVAALQLLSLAATYTGRGEKGTELLRQSIVMGKRLRLIRNHVTPLNNENAPQGDDLTAACQTAWGLFCNASLHSMYCQQSELESVLAPDLSIPGDHIKTDKGKGPALPTSMHLGKTFPHLCRMWAIVHDLIRYYYGKDATVRRKRFDAGFVQYMTSKLLSWADSLPTALARGNGSTHDVVILHIFFHVCMMTLVRPLKLEKSTASLAVGSITEGSAMELYVASSNQLKRLTMIYQAHFSDDAPTVLWHTGCISTANVVIRGPADDPFRRFYFDRVMESYEILYARFPVIIVIVKGLMAMAISGKLVTRQEGYEFVQKLRDSGAHRVQITDRTDAAFVVDLDRSAADKEGGNLDRLAVKFDEMEMWDAFTTVNPGEEDIELEIES